MFTFTLRSDLYRLGVNRLTGMFICSSTCVAEKKSKFEFNFTAYSSIVFLGLNSLLVFSTGLEYLP